MIQTNISLPEELHKEIKKYAYRNNLSMSETIRVALTTSMYLAITGEKILKKNKISERETSSETPKMDGLTKHRGEINAEDYTK